MRRCRRNEWRKGGVRIAECWLMLAAMLCCWAHSTQKKRRDTRTCSTSFYFFVKSFNSDESADSSAPAPDTQSNQPIETGSSNSTKALFNASNPNPNEPPIGYIYQIYCFYDRCSIQNGSYDHFDQRYLNFIFLRSPPKFNVRSFKGKGITYFFVGFDKPVFDNLKKEELNEKSSFSSAIYSK